MIRRTGLHENFCNPHHKQKLRAEIGSAFVCTNKLFLVNSAAWDSANHSAGVFIRPRHSALFDRGPTPNPQWNGEVCSKAVQCGAVNMFMHAYKNWPCRSALVPKPEFAFGLYHHRASPHIFTRQHREMFGSFQWKVLLGFGPSHVHVYSGRPRRHRGIKIMFLATVTSAVVVGILWAWRFREDRRPRRCQRSPTLGLVERPFGAFIVRLRLSAARKGLVGYSHASILQYSYGCPCSLLYRPRRESRNAGCRSLCQSPPRCRLSARLP